MMLLYGVICRLLRLHLDFERLMLLLLRLYIVMDEVEVGVGG
jgi:hypothetical protein